MFQRVPPLIRLVAGVAAVAVGGLQIGCAQRGLVIRHLNEQGVRAIYMVQAEATALGRGEPAGAARAAEQPAAAIRRPGVVIAHGFAGSRKLMLGYAYVLAHAGYAVLAFDFSGHGASRRPLARERLGDEVERAADLLARQPEVDATRLALLGHSMGSAAVLRAAAEHPERYLATIAISPVPAPVTPATPRNLQLQAGTWEPGFSQSARALLAAAGGPNRQFVAGRARELVMIAGAEHLSILFRDASHEGAVRWLDEVFGPPVTERSGYRDRRIVGWLLLVLGCVATLAAARPLIDRARVSSRRAYLVRRPWHLLAVVASPLLASAACALIHRWWPLQRFAGLPVGGALGLWLLIAGTLALLLGCRLRGPSGRDLLRGAGLFAFLWLAVGLSADLVWLQWTLVPERLWRWPLLGLACVPWFVATETIQGAPEARSRAGWWLLQSAGQVAGLLLLVALVPELRLVSLLVPLVPAIGALLVGVGSRVNAPWGYGIGAGLFFGWLLSCSFPLLG